MFYPYYYTQNIPLIVLIKKVYMRLIEFASIICIKFSMNWEELNYILIVQIHQYLQEDCVHKTEN